MSISPTPDEVLHEVLCTCFDAKQLLDFLARRFQEPLSWTLPGPEVGRATFAAAACRALKAQDFVDGALFSAIAEACPRQRAAIVAAAASWGITSLPPAPPCSGVREGDALRRLRRFTRDAQDDAAVVIGEGEPAGRVLLADVYVERNIEQELLAEIVEPRTEGLPILIVGGAGVGKTSLLWQLTGRLRALVHLEAWMLKASAVHTLGADTLTAAVEETYAVGRRPIVLFDTVDLLLHDAARRDRLVELLTVVDELACTFVMACRPGEVQFIPRSLRGIPRAPLGHYDDDELRCAFDRHIAYFHGRTDIREHAEHQRRLAELAAAQRELCTHPLTLRMIFVLYTPGEVPLTLDLAQLYDDFWKRRVQEDLRAGSDVPEDAPDLEEAAGSLALAMLGEGVIALEHARAHRTIRDAGLPAAQLAALIDRGVVRKTEDGSLEFFHQSFFEHAAARGAVHLLGVSGVEMLREQVVRNPSDLLLTAVIEQALTISQSCDLGVRTAAASLFEALFAGNHDTLSGAAVAVYARMRSAERATVERAAAALQSPYVADRFIETVPTIPATRRADLFTHLRSIWRRASDPSSDHWGNCLHILDALPHLAARTTADARLVRAFLTEERVLDAVLDKPHDFHGSRKLLVVLAALAPHDSACWDDLLTLCRRVKKSHSRMLAVVLGTIARQARWLKRPSLAREVEEIVTDIGRTEESLSWGALWAADWRARGLSMVEVLAEVGCEPDLRRLRGRMNGLAMLVAGGTREQATVAWAAFRAERDPSRSSAWIRIVWQELLSGVEGAMEVKDEVVRTIGAAIAALIADEPRDDPLAHEMLVKAVRQAGLPGCVADPLLASERVAATERWERLRDLGHLLPLACLRGHAAAAELTRRLVAEPRAGDPDLVARYMQTLLSSIKRSPNDEQIADLATRLGIAAGDAGKLGQVMQEVGQISAYMRAEGSKLRALAIRQFESASSDAQHGGAFLLHLLIGYDLAPPLDETTVERLASRLGPECTRSFLPLLGDAAPGAASQRALPALIAAARTACGDLRRRQAALEAIIHILRREGGMRELASTIVDLALQSPTDAGNVCVSMWILVDLVPADLDVAAGLLRRLVRDPEVRTLGGAAQRSIRGALRKPMRVYVAAAPTEERQELLVLARETIPKIACLVIDALCREAFEEVEPTLAEMVMDQATPMEVKRLIELQRKIRRRPENRLAWPELAAALAAHGQIRRHGSSG